MSVLANASNIVINGGNFFAHSVQTPKDGEKEALSQLEQHVAFGAFHNSKERYDPPKCLPRTREAVFSEISNWIQVTSRTEPILWLYGPAGAGKSAIAQSIAEKIYQQDILGCLLVATFFFSRSNGERDSASRLIPTIAYQMIFSIPFTRDFVLKAIQNNPRVFSLNLRTQMMKLIIEPLQSASVQCSVNDFPVMLVIVDGLDECQKSKERIEFIQALTESAEKSSCRIIFLCHSRPESDIRTAFNDPQTSKISARLVLDGRYDPDSDIKTLLNHDFAKIRREHPLKSQLPRNWPSKIALDKLIRKSSGQFIYASTVSKYISSRKRNPITQLETVLNVGSGTDASPFKELDALYRLVLSSVDEEDRLTLVRIIGMVCFPGLYGRVAVTPALIDDVLRLESGGTLLILDDLYSLIDVGDSYNELRPYHASIGDFLKDRARSHEYYADPCVVEADCALAYFKAMLSIYDASLRYKMTQEPSKKQPFGGKLTVELFEFFKSIPWSHMIESGQSYNPGRPGRAFWCGASFLDDKCLLLLYEFLKKMSTKASAWAVIYKKAVLEITTGLVDHLNQIFSCKVLTTTHAIQGSLRSAYIRSLLSLEESRDLSSIIIELLVCQTQGPVSGVEKIDAKRRNLAIFDTILEGLVTVWFVDCLESPLPSQHRFFHCKSCRMYLRGLIDLADRTSCVDTLLPYIEKGASLASMALNQDRKVLEGIAQVKQAITAYKEKPVPDDYDYDFRLEPSIETLRERFARQRYDTSANGSSKYLSGLQFCYFTLFEKS